MSLCRFSLRRTNFSPDQSSPNAATFTSTTPSRGIGELTDQLRSLRDELPPLPVEGDGHIHATRAIGADLAVVGEPVRGDGNGEPRRPVSRSRRNAGAHPTACRCQPATSNFAVLGANPVSPSSAVASADTYHVPFAASVASFWVILSV